ncbi:MAG: hypothetical protein F4Y07_16460 [Gemmatimonadetes bacterium]|nr:hypothetical protein [Gemmatimonadota bacterium]MYE18063.1 hypothetical protein [Gemmatimonadota bacterium]
MNLQPLLYGSEIGYPTSSFSGLADDRGRTTQPIIVFSGALSIAGTSSAGSTTMWEAPYIHSVDTTVSGSSWGLRGSRIGNRPEATRKAISELRRISGLTWEQLGQLLGVSRRSVHFWASGKPLNASNEQRLMRVLDVVRSADRGSARSMRAALMDTNQGTAPFDMLAAQRFEDALLILGQRRARFVPALARLSEEAKAARRPLPPEELYDAKSERVHREPGRARAARTARDTRRGSP